MSDTPETDEAEFFIPSRYEEDGLVYADFARRLERGLIQRRGEVEKLRTESERTAVQLLGFYGTEATLLKACDDSGGTLSVEFVRGIINQRRAEG